MKAPVSRRFVVALGLALLAFAAGLPARAELRPGPWIPMFKGVDRMSGTNNPDAANPNQNVIHAVRVDLTDPDVRLFSTPRISGYIPKTRETAGRTVSRFLQVNHLQVAVNADFFNPQDYYLPDGTAMTVSGFTVSDGVVVSSQEGPTDASSVVFDAKKKGRIVHTNWPAISAEGVHTAVSGSYPLVIAGVNIGKRYLGIGGNIHGVNPRTAFGLSLDDRYLYLAVIDGRQPGYSDGALDYETGNWMVLLGAYQAVNMDGGGSSTLVRENSLGNPERLNKPSAVADRGRERTVGSHFGVFAAPLPGFISDVQVQADDVAATVAWRTRSPSTSQVEYGPTTALGLTTPLVSTATTNHAVLLPSLTPGTAYYFHVRSSAAGTDYVSPDQGFTTSNYVASATLLELTNTWRFTTGNLDETAWTSPDYDDTGWVGSGPGLLAVDVRPGGPSGAVSPINTLMPADEANGGFPFVTYYFRTHFQLAETPAGLALHGLAYVDDGAVFYLNGQEVKRLRMDDAPAVIRNDTLSVAYPCDGDATCGDEIVLEAGPGSAARAGVNTLAVEVHNYNPLSPDITFGMSLESSAPQVASALLQLLPTDSGVAVNWTRGGFVLQEAPSPDGPWTDLPGPVLLSPYTAAAGGTARFYRLHR